jgi:serine phosphatase RsbU (regulator of sigma subunit)
MTACLNIEAAHRPGRVSASRGRGPAREREWANARAHRIAEGLQGVLLRTHPPEALPGLTTEAFYEAALDEATVGGDSFDAFALDGGRVALVVADASGKGLAAAERIAEVRFALRAFLREHGCPGLALARLNDFVCNAQRLGRRDCGAFATLTLVVLDCGSGEASCLCAGGEPPLVLRAGGTVETVRVCGPALGLFPSQGYAAAALRLDMNDTLLLTTDGLTEARGLAPVGPADSRVGAFLGLEGLAHLAVQARAHEGTLAQTGRSVFEGARAFAGGAFHDDACLLTARRRPH